jgi:hypothetical protein
MVAAAAGEVELKEETRCERYFASELRPEATTSVLDSVDGNFGVAFGRW